MADEVNKNDTKEAVSEEAPQASEPKIEIASQTSEAPSTAPVRKAPEVPAGKHYFWGTGRRKSSVARVRIRPGSGKIVVNKRDMEKYFCIEDDRNAVIAPLQTVNMLKDWDVFVNVNGGGTTGQAGAVKLGLSRALCVAIPDIERDLRNQKLLTRDARMKERKKYGRKGARKRFQFSKR